MADSVYRKTPLPARLNLADRNTRAQISAGASEKENGRGTLEGVGCATAATAKQSQDSCNDVMRKDLLDWLEKHEIHGPPPSPEAEQKAMWQWIREFHKEYNDDWFTRNMPRLHSQFKPVFMSQMKVLKKAAGQTSAPRPAADNLLEFDASPAPVASTAPAKGGGLDDLLGFGADSSPSPSPSPAAAAAAPAAPVSSAPAAAVQSAGAGSGLDNSLFDLTAALQSTSLTPQAASPLPAASVQSAATATATLTPTPAPAPAVTSASAAAPAAPATSNDLFDLDFGLGSSAAVAASPPPMMAGGAAGAPAVVSSAMPKKEMDLLDLAF